MCGIAGVLFTSNQINYTKLESALEKIKHRGPDGIGSYFFNANGVVVGMGHRRLSIIDLSSLANQPMHTPDGKLSIVFNGEIYNYRELAKELRDLGIVFNTESDTEVLLYAWSIWGKECLQRLEGMFAFTILDKEKNYFYCVRDAFGIKPFYYSCDNKSFFFGSEISVIQEMNENASSLNYQSAYNYLVHGDYDSSSETFFENIYHLPPAHLLEIKLDNFLDIKPQRWWSPETTERKYLKFEDAVEEVREIFLHNVKLHLRSDVPIGSALSGGLDSSAIVCAMRYLEPNMPIHTFSYIASNSDSNEENWVNVVNNYVGAFSHKVSVNSNDLINDLDDLIKTQGEPFGSTSIYAQYRVYKLAKESGVTVTLDGQGADEMLAGYDGYPGHRLKSLLEQKRIFTSINFLKHWSNYPGRSKGLALKYLASELSSGHFYELLRRLDGKPSVPEWINTKALLDKGVKLLKPIHASHKNLPGRRVIEELALSLSGRGLTWLLRHGDRNSMRFSLESRVPFLTIDLANLFLTMPEEYLISSKGETKHVFRNAMRGIVPDSVLNRKDKIGFETPERKLLMCMGPVLNDWISNDLNLPFLNISKIKLEINNVVNGKRPYSKQIWRWLNFLRWAQYNLDKI
ncbi:MAG: asparagine synthase (glutamine-hydrolyzing) [Sediminibacterium sp.]|uniref:asparagine synthase (glutamine-hydrolyzing) n=1 Tax=Sediminibacterium sp. TaxID=1917865 RepID=UPI002AB92929|nr:asparagine synthase (glutamine-hydrolyzing) [Sediminibacterium sp.]MDZ4070734.1 asparagine synthase (glutamine-hydrolyzing) [Sediminibacterium sp.]